MRDTREALGTFVTVTAYGDAEAAQHAVDGAFEAISQSEAVLSAYPDAAADPSRPPKPRTREVTSVAAFNLDPYEWHVLPDEAVRVLDRVRALGVEEYFSPAMLRVTGLYDFEGEKRVPDPVELALFVRAARGFETSRTSFGVQGRFMAMPPSQAPRSRGHLIFPSTPVGLDLSGAAKGAALDAALEVLQEATAEGEVDGALVSAGSTTLVVGTKPADGDAEPWRVGIEDPRDPEKVIGVVEYSPGTSGDGTSSSLPFCTVSTSGDYQQSFVRDGVRYHHILDPATGKPARGMRSLTVVGAPTGLDSDILSTALFVMGADRAEEYARSHGLGLFIVDDQGRTRIVPGPEGAAWAIEPSDE